MCPCERSLKIGHTCGAALFRPDVSGVYNT